MAQKPTLYLHIGHAKAGSTTLQAFLFRNWQQICRAGFALPTARLGLAEGDTPPGNPLGALQDIKASGDISPLERWITAATQKYNKHILSSECLFELKWPKLFTKLTDLVDIQLIYYVRRQDEILLSAWRQWGLKKGLSLGDFITERLETGQPDYWSNMAPWINKVGLVGHHVRFTSAPFLKGGSILSDFCDHLELDMAEMAHVENQNVSHDARLLEFMSHRPELFSSVHDDSIFELLRDKSQTRPDYRLRLTEAQFDAVHRTFEARNQGFLGKFHAEAQGTAAIERSSAPVQLDSETITEDMQRAYVRERLATIPYCLDPRIIALRTELA